MAVGKQRKMDGSDLNGGGEGAVSRAAARHVAIIMDGNGRWAKLRGLPRTAGHRQGVEAVRRIVSAAGDLGVEYLTLFGFSTENWRRPLAEVSELMGLLRFYLRRDVADLHKNGVRLRIVGDRARLPVDIARLIEHAETLTAGNTRLNLTVALSYGGRQEIVHAARQLALDVAAGRLSAEAIDEAALEARLYTAGMPDADLLIRTSGEQRISNFMLWQLAYTECYFTDAHWPDFAKPDLEAALAAYAARERRFGDIKKSEPLQA